MNNDIFMRGLERAFARRAKEKQQQSTVQNVVSDAGGIDITTNINKSTSASIITDNAIASLDRDEQYRTTIIQKMLNHIKSKKELSNDY